ncbi:MAG: Eco57I restriction-modification methylase domain-containing protein, partial [Candidatus Tenebribacter mawsonii]|nr:Eco57I restriction-modification methylase domain-containing protein [Candidatus Tenebribacter mawsonii]
MKTIFNQKYDRDVYLDFLQNYLLPDDFQVEEENVTNDISFDSSRISEITYLGYSEILDISVYEIIHKSEFDPRVSLSKEAFKMMANFSKRKALIFFVPESLVNYRFSLTTIDLDIKGKKIQRLYSNPRRYSFLLGAEAKLGTIFDKLLDTKIIEKTKRVSDFKDLKERFSVESVSIQFFKEYKELYEKIKVTFDKIPNFKIVESKHIESNFIELFSRKLLGQIVFIYFLQRKKWLGGDPSNIEWNDGKLDFLDWAFKYCSKNNLNFFDSFLEKLFYKGFNEKGSSFEFNGMFIKVPFLNGGLFEKFYTSDETLILHPPNSLFSNNDGTGILDILDKYNFTIDENTFFEQEVGVDPEMLGKVFENLLPENLRKGKGAFYTPREIVSYMTRESLINYLKTKLEGSGINSETLEEKIRHLFEYKDYYVSKKESEEMDFEKQFYELFDIVENVIKHLKSIKIVDPAVGSGAFPMGILLDIVSLREYIEKEFLNNNIITSYDLKKETIQNSIYGVDIDPGAVEIAKLRFWLSLVVDAEKPEALPNLDYKIMQGNSLIETFAGINFGKKSETDKIEVNSNEIKHLHDKQEALFNCDDNNNKLKLRNEIDEIVRNLYHSIIEKSKEDYYIAHQHLIKMANSFGNNEARKEYLAINEKRLQKQFKIDFSEADKILHDFSKKDKVRPFFPWHLYFADVFKVNDGFDIVIGNPPYVSTKGISIDDKQNLLAEFDFADDLYSHFYFKGLSLLKPDTGFLSYISSKTFWTIQTKKNLRKLFLNHKIYEIYDTANPFEAAMVDTCIMSVNNEIMNDDYPFLIKDGKEEILSPVVYKTNANLYSNSVNNVFFLPTEMNLKIYYKYNHIVKDLITAWWDKIKTSRDITKNKYKLNQYRESLKPGDVTLLGLITDGGVGLQTGNNGKYVGILKGTKYAIRTIETRPHKFLEAIKKHKIDNYKSITDLSESEKYLADLNENEIRNLFDELKEKYGRDIFGQGYLFRIVSKDDIADVDSLTDNEQKNGINNSVSFVPYDKGDREGNRWYLRTPYYIDWNRENVKILQTDPKARWQGYDFFFRRGFCWTNVLNPNARLIKCRLKDKSINDVGSMSLYCIEHKLDNYFVSLINSNFLFDFYR